MKQPKLVTVARQLELAILEHRALFGATTRIVVPESTFRAVLTEFGLNVTEAIIEGAIAKGGTLLSTPTTVVKRAQFVFKIIGGRPQDPPELEYVHETRRQTTSPEWEQALKDFQRRYYGGFTWNQRRRW